MFKWVFLGLDGRHIKEEIIWGRQMMNEWLQHRNVLEGLLESIDNDHIDFKPWDDAMTLAL